MRALVQNTVVFVVVLGKQLIKILIKKFNFSKIQLKFSFLSLNLKFLNNFFLIKYFFMKSILKILSKYQKISEISE